MSNQSTKKTAEDSSQPTRAHYTAPIPSASSTLLSCLVRPNNLSRSLLCMLCLLLRGAGFRPPPSVARVHRACRHYAFVLPQQSGSQHVLTDKRTEVPLPRDILEAHPRGRASAQQTSFHEVGQRQTPDSVLSLRSRFAPGLVLLRILENPSREKKTTTCANRGCRMELDLSLLL